MYRVIREYVKASTKNIDSDDGFGYFCVEYNIAKGVFKKTEIKMGDTNIRVRQNCLYEGRDMNGWKPITKEEFDSHKLIWNDENKKFIELMARKTIS